MEMYVGIIDIPSAMMSANICPEDFTKYPFTHVGKMKC
jgi:hypothetical protein